MIPELCDEETERLMAIRDKYRIEPERFRNGYIFAVMIDQGETRVEAYMEAFSCDRIKATQSATNLYGAGWIQSILGEIELDQSARAKEDMETIREEMVAILINTKSTATEKTAAATRLESISKKKVKAGDEADDKDSAAEAILSQLKRITSGTNKMISPMGHAIDVPIMD